MMSLFVISISVFVTLVPSSTCNSFSVNKLIGDLSFKEKYDHFPVQTCSQDLRIRTHLEYAELVIRRQTQNKTDNGKKMNALDRLNHYWKEGQFPQHSEILHIGGNRSPRFIDHDNVHCAVAYLVLTSPGFEQLPKEINLDYEYSYIEQIKNENLQQWMHLYGFTKDELALIQPTYKHMNRPKPVVIAPDPIVMVNDTEPEEL